MKTTGRQKIIHTYLVFALFISLLFSSFPVQSVIIDTDVDFGDEKRYEVYKYKKS